MNQETPPKENRVADEFRELGDNLVKILRTAWESPERKRIQQDITNGLNELGSTLRNETEKFNESETAQKIRSGEVESRFREEVLSALKTVNAELERAVERMSRAGTRAASEGTPRQEENPAGGTGKGWEQNESVGQDSTESPVGPSPHGHYEIDPDDEAAHGPGTQHQEVNPDDTV